MDDKISVEVIVSIGEEIIHSEWIEMRGDNVNFHDAARELLYQMVESPTNSKVKIVDGMTLSFKKKQ